MPTATANPADCLRRLQRLPKLPATPPAELARLRRLVGVDGAPDADAPDAGDDVPGLNQFNPPPLVAKIRRSHVAWFETHGGVVALNRVLAAYIRDQDTKSVRVASRRRVARGPKMR